MNCGKHDNLIVLHAFSSGPCVKCSKTVDTAHIPCNKVCIECSIIYKICEVCADEIKKIAMEELRDAILALTEDYGKPGNTQKANIWKAFSKLENCIKLESNEFYSKKSSNHN